MHDSPILPQPAPVRDWRPNLPAGKLRTLMLHWTAGDYQTVFPAYHFCLSGSREVLVHTTCDLRANMRDVRGGPANDYAAHTHGRNSFAVGIAVCAMRDAMPHDFGQYSVTPAQIEALCLVSARLVRAYGIAIDAVRTHAEVALDDGYFGAGKADLRWDIARLLPLPGPLGAAEARSTGARLRARVVELG